MLSQQSKLGGNYLESLQLEGKTRIVQICLFSQENPYILNPVSVIPKTWTIHLNIAVSIIHSPVYLVPLELGTKNMHENIWFLFWIKTYQDWMEKYLLYMNWKYFLKIFVACIWIEKLVWVVLTHSLIFSVHDFSSKRTSFSSIGKWFPFEIAGNVICIMFGSGWDIKV